MSNSETPQTVDDLLRGARDPYELARRLGTDRYLNQARAASNWRRAFFASLGVVALSIAGMVYLGAQPKTVPYTVAVDRIGNVIAVGVPDNQHKIDAQRVLYAQLQEWLQDARSVINDPAFQRKALAGVYNRVANNSQCRAFLDEYFRANNPYVRMKEESVEARVTNVLQESASTWRMEWLETRRALNGDVRDELSWKALITFDRQLPTDADGISKNPIGVWCKQLSWEKVQ